MPAEMNNTYEARFTQLGGADIYADIALRPDLSQRVRAHLWPSGNMPAEKRVLFLPGFTEFCEKHAHTAKRLVDLGYQVLMIDWPGQGRSGHLAKDELAVHIDDFAQYDMALDAVLTTAGWRADRFLLIGHSMGGHMALRSCGRLGGNIRAALLMAPMICPHLGPAKLIVGIAQLLGKTPLYARGAPTQKNLPMSLARRYSVLNPLTHDPAYYDLPYQWFERAPELRRTIASVGWVRAAYQSCLDTSLNEDWLRQQYVPIKALLAGQEYICSLPAAKRYLAYLPNADIAVIEEARHEIFSETADIQARVWPEIEAFLARYSDQ